MPDSTAAWRRINIGALLFASSDRFLREKLAHLRANGFPGVTDAQLTLLLALDEAGTRPTTLANRLGLTKSSVAELLDRTETGGWVMKTADPSDNRARVVVLTAAGTKALAVVRQAIDAAEATFERQAGGPLTERFKTVFGCYAAEGGPEIHPSAERTAEWYRGNAGRVLALAARRFAREVLAIVHARGQQAIGEAVLSLIRNLDLEGSRLTELAIRAHTTKQAMRELVDRAEALGHVARSQDASDARAKLIRFTPAGLAMLEDMRRGVEIAERDFAMRTDKTFLAEICRVLMAYAGTKHADPA